MSFFRKNLFHLRRVLPGLAEQVSGFPPHSDDDSIYRRTDLEAERTVSGHAFSKVPRLLLFYGIGFGGCLHRFLKNPPRWTREFLVIERNLGQFATALRFYDFSGYFGRGDLTLLVGLPLDRLATAFSDYIGTKDRFTLLESIEAIVDLESIKLDQEYYRFAVDRLKQIVSMYDRGLGNAPADNFLGFSNTMSNAERIIKARPLSPLERGYDGVTGVVISSGPSLDRSIDQLRKLDGEAVIVCADSALGRVLDEGIHPDFVTIVERDEAQAQVFAGIDEKVDIPLVAANVVHKKSLESYPGEVVHVFRSENIANWFPFSNMTRMFVGSSCGNFSFSLVDFFGCNPIVIFGQDLAFDRNSKSSHFSRCVSLQIVPDYERQRLLEPFYLVEGNNGLPIDTTGYWLFFKQQLEMQIFRSRKQVFNVIAEDFGARIIGAKPIDDIDLVPGLGKGKRTSDPRDLLFDCQIDPSVELANLERTIAATQAELSKIDHKLQILEEKMNVEGMDIQKFQSLCQWVETNIKNNLTYNNLLFAIGSPLFMRNLIHFFKWEPTFHDPEIALFQRKALLNDWLRETKYWTGRLIGFFEQR